MMFQSKLDRAIAWLKEKNKEQSGPYEKGRRVL